ncbi:two-component response regulator ORR1-like [Zingiber officinale]|uniref:two-component response regulator ORR1-like n=1 Tax=Zingiber officinale TaxID=94328 RepID=UPI001C4CF93F|nr:two-component response regulator ORR1-like [Zingiber officinale]
MEGMEEELKKEEGEVVGKAASGGGGGGDGGRGMRVLVVDDSPVDRKIAEMLLKKNGGMFEVIPVDSGIKALEVLGLNEGKSERTHINEQKIDIVLTDYFMPHMTGYDLLKTVKENSNLRSIPVVMMSSENDPEIISSCKGIGAEDFFVKPFKLKDVQRLRTYAAKTPMCKHGTKRKLPVDVIPENSSYESCPRVPKVAVA